MYACTNHSVSMRANDGQACNVNLSTYSCPFVQQHTAEFFTQTFGSPGDQRNLTIHVVFTYECTHTIRHTTDRPSFFHAIFFLVLFPGQNCHFFLFFISTHAERLPFSCYLLFGYFFSTQPVTVSFMILTNTLYKFMDWCNYSSMSQSSLIHVVKRTGRWNYIYA